MTCYCSLVHFIKWILALTGRLHLILASKYDLIPIDFETVLAREMFYINSRKSKNFHTEQYQGIKMFQFSYCLKFCKLLSNKATVIFKWCCKSYHKTCGMMFLHKVRVKTHLIWNSHHRPNQDLHLCQGNYISLSHHGRNHNDIPERQYVSFPKFLGLISKSYGNCWTNSSGMLP